MVAAGRLIWISVRPLIRLTLCVASGFAVSKADIFPQEAARGAGQVMLYVALPCLMFSKIVPAFDSENIKALGPLIVVASLYEALGIIMAWIVKKMFWVPHRFRYGILAAGGFSNCGDIPFAVVMSITGAAPFHGSSDQALSVAYISAFILVYMLTFFPMGGSQLIAKDFVGPDIEPEEVRHTLRSSQKQLVAGLTMRLRHRSISQTPPRADDPEHARDSPVDEEPKFLPENELSEKRPQTLRTDHGKHVSFREDVPASLHSEGFRSPRSSVAHITERTGHPTPAHTHTTVVASEDKTVTNAIAESSSTKSKSTMWTKAKPLIMSFFSPASISICLSIPIAVVPQLKALFVPVPNIRMPSAPDDQPPLAFVIDSANFIGSAAVPMGLICLGAALARMNIPSLRRPKEWENMPVGAILALAVAKMLIFPVIGVLITDGLVHAGLINKEDKVLQFVCMFFSCLPTATTQVYITQVYSGTGSAEHVPAFLIPQYFFMFFSMTGMTAYALQRLF